MDKSYNGLLNRSCVSGNLEDVKLALSQGADIHATDDCALQLACYNERLVVVEYLFSQGADIHAVDDYALCWASSRGHLDVVRYLVSKCSANVHAGYAVKIAAYNGHLDIVRYLVSQGADIHADYGNTLRWASENRQLETVGYLVSQGASIIYVLNSQRNYASIYAKHYKRREIRAVSRIYFWWIRRCYPISRASGIRMAFRNLAAYETLCDA